MSGETQAGTVWYCPWCEARPATADPGQRGRWLCDRCGTALIAWPADLPLPTEANVRGLVVACQALAREVAAMVRMDVLERAAPAANPNGRWN